VRFFVIAIQNNCFIKTEDYFFEIMDVMTNTLFSFRSNPLKSAASVVKEE
jgi:hypothetical protein